MFAHTKLKAQRGALLEIALSEACCVLGFGTAGSLPQSPQFPRASKCCMTHAPMYGTIPSLKITNPHHESPCILMPHKSFYDDHLVSLAYLNGHIIPNRAFLICSALSVPASREVTHLLGIASRSWRGFTSLSVS